MINSEYIREWRPEHPWFTESMVEQDLLISRTLVAIFSDSFLKERLAFRGRSPRIGQSRLCGISKGGGLIFFCSRNI